MSPWGLRWRSSNLFIIATVAVGMFTDLFLYGLVVPVLPFMLRDRVQVQDDQIQTYVSGLLAAYAGATVLFSVPAGYIADHLKSRQVPFLAGLFALLAATVMFAFAKSIPVLVIARILQGTSAAVVWTVGLAMVLDTVGPKNLGKAIGSIFSFITVGELAAPVLGGLLYKKTGYGGVFGLGAGILVVDFIMRLFVIEKKVAARYEGLSDNEDGAENESDDSASASEEDSLLPHNEEDEYKIPPNQPNFIQAVPFLYCLSNIRLLIAFSVGFVQALLLTTFDATIPTESEELFGFDSLTAGLLFIPLDIPYLILGPIAGWVVDKYGTKLPAVSGFTFLIPMLTLLRLPADHVIKSQTHNIILYCALLAINSVGLAFVSSPGLVEASLIVQKYERANPGFFGDNGPYAQLYGFNSLLFSAGLTMGPILGGVLRDSIGYGNMNAVLAVVSAFTAVLSFIYVGGKPRIWSSKTLES